MNVKTIEELKKLVEYKYGVDEAISWEQFYILKKTLEQYPSSFYEVAHSLGLNIFFNVEQEETEMLDIPQLVSESIEITVGCDKGTIYYKVIRNYPDGSFEDYHVNTEAEVKEVVQALKTLEKYNSL